MKCGTAKILIFDLKMGFLDGKCQNEAFSRDAPPPAVGAIIFVLISMKTLGMFLANKVLTGMNVCCIVDAVRLLDLFCCCKGRCDETHLFWKIPARKTHRAGIQPAKVC